MNKIQKKLLAEKDLTYTKAVEIAVAMEVASRDVKELHNQRSETVNKLNHKSQKPSNLKKQLKPKLINLLQM